jgi:hypothetical protein
MPHELIPQNQQIEAPDLQETLPHSQRLVILGSRISGAFDLANQVDSSLKERGIEGVGIGLTRDVSHIDDAFFGRSPQAPSPALPRGETAAADKPTKRLLGWLGSKLLQSDVIKADDVSQQDENTAARPDSIPAAVLIFAHMRQYGPDGTGFTIDTPVEGIEKLCAKYGVPFTYVTRNDEAPGTIDRSIGKLFDTPKQLPPATS